MTAPHDDTSSGHGSSPVLLSRRDGVLTATLHHPEAFNAFSREMKTALLDTVRAAAQDDTVRVLVLTGAGRAFCAGQDLKEHLALMEADDPEVRTTVSSFYTPLVTEITQMHKPVIAAVNGVAAGAGAALAFACDLRIARPSASFSMAFASAALCTDTGASYTLPRLIGTGRAMRMLLLDEKVSATEAERIGLVDILTTDDDFATRVDELAARLAAGPTGAYSWIKRAVAHAATSDLASALQFEDRAQAACFSSSEHRAALSAFVSQRKPRA